MNPKSKLARSFLLLVTWLGVLVTAKAADPTFWSWAEKPPMGWNSWDCFGAGVWQADVLANADYMVANLKSHGWNLVTIDIQWYEPRAHTDQYRPGAVLEMDANGRLLPATNRFPMTADSRSFKPMADYLHSRGLKFGLHMLRGIPRQAVDRDNSPILGTAYHAADIADKINICRWNADMYGVDMSKPGAQEYYDSVFALLASWDLDFVKVDDLSAPDYQTTEVEAIRRAIDKTGRHIVFSTSPGATPLAQGANVETNANQWRVSNDFWDNWNALNEQFARLNNWTPFRAPGHWPDADMIPFGNIRAWQENDAWTHFTHDEQYTLMTLWSIARSPLILGANLPKNDDFTLSLLTNDAVIAVNQNSTGNKQVYNATNHVVWVADIPGSKDKYVALFNAPPQAPRGRRGRANTGDTNAAAGATANATTNANGPAEISVEMADIGLAGSCQVRDVWTGKDLGAMTGAVKAMVNPHGAALLRVHPGN
jgi:alpha-galactosidase